MKILRLVQFFVLFQRTQGEHLHRKRRAVIAPLLIGTGIAAALGTKIGGISTSAHFYCKLSQELNDDMEQVVESFVSIQRQINSLASVALQSRQALDILTAVKGRTCLFLGEDCCYFVNETAIVQGRVKEFRDRIERRRKELQNLYSPQNLFQQVLPWLLPFLGPLELIIIVRQAEQGKGVQNGGGYKTRKGKARENETKEGPRMG